MNVKKMTVKKSVELTNVVEEADHLEYSWKILKKDATKSIFTKKKMREYIPLGRVLGFISANMGISYVGMGVWADVMKATRITSEQDHMECYKNNYNKVDGYFHTSYSLSKHSYGRINPNGYLSASILCRPTRHTFVDGFYRDLDMKNCQPVAVYERCLQMGIAESFSSLKKYCDNTKALRSEIMAFHNVSKDMAKQLPIRILFGGSYDEWIKDNGVEEGSKLKTFSDMEAQLKPIMTLVYKDNMQMVKDLTKDSVWAKKTDNAKKRSVMGLWGQSMERFFQEEAISFLVEEKGFLLEDIIPSQDGFMVRNQYWYDGIEDDCSQAVKDKFAINIVFEEKQFDEKFDLISIDVVKNFEIWNDTLSVKLLSDRLIKEFGDYILRDRENGELFIYWDKRWYNETTTSNKRYIWRLISEKLYELICPEINTDISLTKKERDMLLRDLRNNTSQKVRMNEIILHSLSKCNEMVCEFDNNPFLLGFDDCVYDLEKGEERDYNYNDYMTLSVGYDFPKIDYNDVSNEDHIKLKDDLSDMFRSIQPSEDDLKLLFQILASGLDGIAYQKVFFFNGAGGNGKGVIGGLMGVALGQYYYQGGNAILKEAEKANAPSPDILLLKNKRYVNFKELEGTLNASILRNLTGGGKFSGRMLNSNPVNFEMSASFVAEFNNHPDLNGKPMEADYRRMVDFKFPINFTSDEKKIGHNIGGVDYKESNEYYVSNTFKEKSRDMFMAMLLNIYKISRNSNGMVFNVPQHIKDRTNLYLANQNVFKRLTDLLYTKVEVNLNDRKDIRSKSMKANKMWTDIQNEEDYRLLTSREKKNQYNRDNFYQHLNNEFRADDRAGVALVIVGVQYNSTFEDDSDDDDVKPRPKAKDFTTLMNYMD
tara:strand:+ start:7413 stop:10046 length:2634 start_codon:yes stop_codon:yes gene_type:complete